MHYANYLQKREIISTLSAPQCQCRIDTITEFFVSLDTGMLGRTSVGKCVLADVLSNFDRYDRYLFAELQVNICII